MRMQVEYWQIFAAIATLILGSATIIGMVVKNHSEVRVRLSALEIEVRQLQANELKTEKKFDQIMDKLERILVELQNKQDKDY